MDEMNDISKIRDSQKASESDETLQFLGELEQNSQPGENTATLKLKLELERVERQWLQGKQRYGLAVGVPVSIFGFFCALLGIVLIAEGLSEPKELGIWPGVMVFVIGMATGCFCAWRSKAYYHTWKKYQNRRKGILCDLVASRARGQTPEKKIDEPAG